MSLENTNDLEYNPGFKKVNFGGMWGWNLSSASGGWAAVWSYRSHLLKQYVLSSLYFPAFPEE